MQKNNSSVVYTQLAKIGLNIKQCVLPSFPYFSSRDVANEKNFLPPYYTKITTKLA